MTALGAFKIVRGSFMAPALVSSSPLSFFGDVDAATGVVVGARTDLVGQSLAGKVLCLPRTYGSNGSWRVIQLMAKNRCGPAAIVIADPPDPSVVQGAILAELPILRLESAVDFNRLTTGQMLRHEKAGQLEILDV